jgi:hypothetical protein
VDGVSGGDFLERPALIDRLHGELDLELGSVNAGIAKMLLRRFSQRVEPLSRAVTRLRGVSMGAGEKDQGTADRSASCCT